MLVCLASGLFCSVCVVSSVVLVRDVIVFDGICMYSLVCYCSAGSLVCRCGAARSVYAPQALSFALRG